MYDLMKYQNHAHQNITINTRKLNLRLHVFCGHVFHVQLQIIFSSIFFIDYIQKNIHMHSLKLFNFVHIIDFDVEIALENAKVLTLELLKL